MPLVECAGCGRSFNPNVATDTRLGPLCPPCAEKWKTKQKAEKAAEKRRREAQKLQEKQRREAENARSRAEAEALARKEKELVSDHEDADSQQAQAEDSPSKSLSARDVVIAIVITAVLLGVFGVCEFRSPPRTSSSPSTAGQRPYEPKPKLKYSVLRRWKPDRSPNGLGLELVLEEEASETQLISFVRSLSAGKYPIFIGIYIDREAYYDDSRIAQGLVLVYMKRGSCNEIRWMQEIGRYSHRFGKKTKF